MKTARKLEIVLSTIAGVLIIGTLAYHSLEGWGYVDSFYFTGVTMTTIGYGDLHPTTPLSKIFTVFFAFAGVGVSLFALSLFAAAYFEHRERIMNEAAQRKLVAAPKNKVDGKAVARRKRAILRGSRI